MIGLVIVAHGSLADSLLQALEHVVGPQEKAVAVAIAPESDIDRARDAIRDAVDRTRCDGGVLILTDMFGGTPSNLALSVMENDKVDVVAGVNLPMLVKLSEIRRDLPLAAAAQEARAAGRKYIHIAGALLADTPQNLAPQNPGPQNPGPKKS